MELGERERLRRSFQPCRVQLLFVGESPPASGRFFYSGNSGLYRAMRAAFEQADPRVHEENFLAFFRSYGCYLVDLSLEPVDHLDVVTRRSMCKAGEEHLTNEIVRFQPEVIAPLLRSIASNVEHAAAGANWNGRLVPLPYPGRWSRLREAFIETLLPVVRQLRWKDDCELNSELSRSGL